jgi:hypothetical protein
MFCNVQVVCDCEVLRPDISSPSKTELHHVNCTKWLDGCLTYLAVQTSAVIAHFARYPPLGSHGPVQFFARLVQNLWSLCHCSLVLAFLGVFIRSVTCRLALRRCQLSLRESAYNHFSKYCLLFRCELSLLAACVLFRCELSLLAACLLFRCELSLLAACLCHCGCG